MSFEKDLTYNSNEKLKENKIEFYKKIQNLFDKIDNLNDDNNINNIIDEIKNTKNEIINTKHFKSLKSTHDNGSMVVPVPLYDDEKDIASGKKIKCHLCYRVITNRSHDIKRHQQSSVCKNNRLTIENNTNVNKIGKIKDVIDPRLTHSLIKIHKIKHLFYTGNLIMDNRDYEYYGERLKYLGCLTNIKWLKEKFEIFCDDRYDDFDEEEEEKPIILKVKKNKNKRRLVIKE